MHMYTLEEFYKGVVQSPQILFSNPYTWQPDCVNL